MFAASKTGGVVASAGDPYWTSVSLLTNFENNLTFQDGSTNNFAITRTGTVNPNLNTPFSGVGGSEYFNGTTGYLTWPSGSTAAFGTGNFTVECWVYLTSAPTVNFIIDFRDSTHTTAPIFLWGDITSGVLYWDKDSSSVGAISGTATWNTNTWYHVAYVRNGTTGTLYQNGVSIGSGTDSTNYTVVPTTSTIGNRYALSFYYPGFISNLRIVKGTAVYTANFTPPTAPLTAITNTSLLITGTGQGMFDNSTFVDQGPNALTVTATGAPVYSGLSPFGNTYAGSIKYTTNSQYLNCGSSAVLALGAGDFTVEVWLYLTQYNASTSSIIDWRNAGGVPANIPAITLTAAGVPWFYANVGSGPLITSSTAISLNTWTHFTVVRNGSGSNNVSMYLNGTNVGNGTNTATLGIQALLIGDYQGTFATYGNYSNVRVVKGTAVYTANFTPSTTPLTAITNTSLLVRGDTGAFYDLSNVGNPESGSGSPVVTTQVKKFGNESGSFNGTTSYLTTPDNAALNMGAADFTLEAWIYLTSTPGVATNDGANVINKDGKAATSWAQYNLFVSSALKVCASFSSVPNSGGAPTAVITGTTTLLLNTWYYVAVTRSGVNGTVWVNGASNGTTASIPATLANGARSLYIGYEEAQAAFAYFPGYIDDVRITKGVARTITTPTVTFPTGP